MSSYIECDVCDNKAEIGKNADWLRAVVPASWWGSISGLDAEVDICSPQCLVDMAQAMSGEEPEEVDVDAVEEHVSRFTPVSEQMGGVRLGPPQVHIK